MIYGFDFDGTLVQSWTATPLPGVRERLAQLPSGAKTFIASNQAGPAFRAVLQDAKHPTVEDVAGRIAQGLAALHWRPDLVLVSCCAAKDGLAWWRAEAAAASAFDKILPQLLGALPVLTFVMSHYRKPQAGMLLAAQQRLGGAELVYVGDMESDALAAANGHARYIDAAAWRAGAD
jgi:phosphoglycolate phosphatase-like HAD superfamily hydrolase